MKVLRFALLFVIGLVFNNISASAKDGDITFESIQKIHLKEPARALHLLDSAEQHRLPGIQAFQIDILRSMCYDAMGEYVLKEKYTRSALASDSVRLVPSRKLHMLSILIVTLVEQGKNEEAIRYGQEAIDLARQLNRLGKEGEILFAIGRIYRNMNRMDEALKFYQQGINTMQHSNDVRVMAILSTGYGDLMNLLSMNNRWDEAAQIGKEREELIGLMSTKPGPPPGYIDQQYGYLYSKMAFLLMLAGHTQEAETYYRKFTQTDFSKTPVNAGEIIPYLLQAHRYTDALALNEKDMSNYQDAYGNDTVNYVYWIILDRFAQAYRGLQQYKTSDAYQQRLTVLSDSIYTREQESRAHQYAVAFNLHEKDLLLAESRLQSQKRGFLLIGSFVIIFLLCTLIGIIIRNWRMTLSRNKIAAKQIDDLLAQREEARNAYRQKAETASVVPTAGNDALTDETPHTDEESSNSIEYKRFLHIEYTVVKDRLFLQPNFGRDELMALGNINKNNLPRMLRKYANAENVSAYLNRLRIEYAVKLMKENPYMSFDAIAKGANFNSHSTFYRAFYKVYGMTPAQYMKAQEGSSEDTVS